MEESPCGLTAKIARARTLTLRAHAAATMVGRWGVVTVKFLSTTAALRPVTNCNGSSQLWAGSVSKRARIAYWAPWRG